eukprot:TRINITY_DN1371_c0_g1_i1.p1 TRINITY_DN1371_c0_g1~~TRINITY_DN1371_c0_g1_i1.p1  ORF type:complete len:243 (+),score=24.04 TRINITY_DN1371_c0_g1_i1:23-730(+)
MVEIPEITDNHCRRCAGEGHKAFNCTSRYNILETATDDTPKCRLCGGLGHFIKTCSSIDESISCYKCGGHGHFKRFCTSAPGSAEKDLPECFICSGKGHRKFECPSRPHATDGIERLEKVAHSTERGRGRGRGSDRGRGRGRGRGGSSFAKLTPSQKLYALELAAEIIESNPQSSGQCYFCREFGHKSTNCPKKNSQDGCFVCHSTEHRAKDCTCCKLCKQPGHFIADCPRNTRN